jgi:hypothetical protein
MKKKIVKQIEEVAGTLPLVMRNTCEKHIMTGKEMIEDLDWTKIDGKPVLPSERYLVNQPVQIAINHKRKMKKLYQKYDVAGVHGYINAVKNYAEKEGNVTN